MSAVSLEIESLRKEPLEVKLAKLRQIKNWLIGCSDAKETYYDLGILEIMFQMVQSEEDARVLLEILAIINSFFFDFDRAKDSLKCYTPNLVQIHTFLPMYSEIPLLTDMILRVIKNQLSSDLVSPVMF